MSSCLDVNAIKTTSGELLRPSSVPTLATEHGWCGRWSHSPAAWRIFTKSPLMVSRELGGGSQTDLVSVIHPVLRKLLQTFSLRKCKKPLSAGRLKLGCLSGKQSDNRNGGGGHKAAHKSRQMKDRQRESGSLRNYPRHQEECFEGLLLNPDLGVDCQCCICFWIQLRLWKIPWQGDSITHKCMNCDFICLPTLQICYLSFPFMSPDVASASTIKTEGETTTVVAIKRFSCSEELLAHSFHPAFRSRFFHLRKVFGQIIKYNRQE